MHYVAGLMFSEDHRSVAMVLKNRPAWQAGLFNAIGGKIEENETPVAAMVREFYEETGIVTVESDWKFFTLLDGAGFQVNFFTAFSNQVYNATTMESETIQLVDPFNLPMNTIINIRWLVPLALDPHTVVPRIVKHAS